MNLKKLFFTKVQILSAGKRTLRNVLTVFLGFTITLNDNSKVIKKVIKE